MTTTSLPNLPGSTTTFFHEHGIAVTDRWLEVNGERYAVSQLQNLRYVTWPMCRFRSVGLAGGLAFPLLAALTAPYASSILLWQLAAFGSGTMFILALLSMWFHPRHYSLWATINGRRVELYQTTDRIMWGKVGRALMRAAGAARHNDQPPSEAA